jgi:hypothetical protein
MRLVQSTPDRILKNILLAFGQESSANKRWAFSRSRLRPPLIVTASEAKQSLAYTGGLIVKVLSFSLVSPPASFLQ